MNNDFDNIVKSIKQLSTGDKLKILYLLNEEQNKKPTEDEIITFVSQRTQELEKWNEDVDELLRETRQFFNELDKTV